MKASKQEALRWLEQARYDLKAAEWNKEGKLYAHACFLAQQSAEKSLKAFLYYQGERIVLGHSVAELSTACLKYSKDFNRIVEAARLLDRYYVPTRYPNGLPGGVPSEVYAKEDAIEALREAHEIFSLAKGKIK